jgi:phosphorylase/glycogen(starch) synthase
MERTFTDQGHQNDLDAEMIYTTIEEQIAPMYYDRDEKGIPAKWCKAVKSCVADIASNFTTNRMLTDYEERFYNQLAERHQSMVADNYIQARELAAWKRKVSAAWDNVKVLDVERVRVEKEALFVGESYNFQVSLDIANLKPEDIGVELVVAKPMVGNQAANVDYSLTFTQTKVEGSEVSYSLEYTPKKTGIFDVAIRIFPKNEKLAHRMDFALVKWC